MGKGSFRHHDDSLSQPDEQSTFDLSEPSRFETDHGACWTSPGTLNRTGEYPHPFQSLPNPDTQVLDTCIQGQENVRLPENNKGVHSNLHGKDKNNKKPTPLENCNPHFSPSRTNIGSNIDETTTPRLHSARFHRTGENGMKAVRLSDTEINTEPLGTKKNIPSASTNKQEEREAVLKPTYANTTRRTNTKDHKLYHKKMRDNLGPEKQKVIDEFDEKRITRSFTSGSHSALKKQKVLDANEQGKGSFSSSALQDLRNVSPSPRENSNISVQGNERNRSNTRVNTPHSFNSFQGASGDTIVLPLNSSSSSSAFHVERNPMIRSKSLFPPIETIRSVVNESNMKIENYTSNNPLSCKREKVEVQQAHPTQNFNMVSQVDTYMTEVPTNQDITTDSPFLPSIRIKQEEDEEDNPQQDQEEIYYISWKLKGYDSPYPILNETAENYYKRCDNNNKSLDYKGIGEDIGEVQQNMTSPPVVGCSHA